MKIKTREEIVASVRVNAPQIADEVEGWRCPDCGAPATVVSQTCSATYIEGRDDAARVALGYGIDVGPPRTVERPVAYELTFGCENGHEHYIRTLDVTS